MTNELKEISYYELDNVDISKLPSLINDQLTSLKELEEKVNIALNKAEEAKSTAQRAHSKSIGWFGRGTKDAVYLLQDATKDLADAQYLSADTQKVILQYQAKLAEISKYLFALGVFNIAANRTIVRELELKLKNGSLSKGKVSELAQQEILNVIKQLKAQEDIMVKQEKMTNKIKQHQIILDYNKQVDSEHEKLIKQLISEDGEQDKLLQKHSQTDEKHEELINKLISEDDEQDKLLEKHSQIDEKHEELINKLISEDDEQDKLLEKHSQIDEKHEDLINKLISEDDEQDKILEKHEERNREFEIKIELLENEIKELKNNCENLEIILKNKTDRKITYVLIGLIIVSLICSMIQFL